MYDDKTTLASIADKIRQFYLYNKYFYLNNINIFKLSYFNLYVLNKKYIYPTGYPLYQI